MAGQEVTFDEVAAAAARLQNDGEPITIEAVREVLDAGSTNAIHKHLTLWRIHHAEPAEPPKAALPPSLLAALGDWAKDYAEEAGSGARDELARTESDMEALLESGEQLEAERDDLLDEVSNLTIARDQALATIAERAEDIERLTAELRDARRIATDALVGKAKDQLAIEGKDSQLADLRAQMERNVATSASQSDARLSAEMELVGATTARDNFAAEAKDLRARLDACIAERSALRAEVDVLRANRKQEPAS